ncbi:DUF4450 domain-containing protein [Caulobacter sp. RL271]|uniref:DUF4450 domain-containing protein n=1 Tax=Caulobacter segnis TaxID=88688 RepID=A0ABY4ZNB8_9CAUL|nr:DUF4450 domain-containing protein [Caulobacter segnis]USQ94218.1 DUF4450 domain-containing protein [Caulobacter segnis]
MARGRRYAGLALALCASLSATGALAQTAPSAVGGPTPNLVGNIERPIRYHPQDGDFVIENGTETFNRPLYGGDTAFRVDGGDKPEFVLYLPGRGGNLRLGVAGPSGARWLHAAQRIVTRYRPGELIYEIRDPLLGQGVLRIEALAYAVTEGLTLRVEGADLPPGLQLVWAFGGITGQRGVRDGDIGTEKIPISEWFQFKPTFAETNGVITGAEGFEVSAPQAVIVGSASSAARFSRGDATAWDDLGRLLKSSAPDQGGVAIGRARLTSNAPLIVSLQRVDPNVAGDLVDYTAVRAGRPDSPVAPVIRPPAFARTELAVRFEEARSHFQALRAQVRIDTPDPYIKAAMAALNVGAEATWDGPQQAVMHGAVAWRTKLLGWRGPYWLDALGRADRADQHFRDWAKGQNVSPIPAAVPPLDEDANLARAETALHSNGDLSNSHYDMNTVYIDALFRHLDWTGDLKLARDLWPTIQRHLAWERRLFRREYGPDKLALYEAYAAIWASDHLSYNGGGAAHASAYQAYHNRMAAKLVRLIGEDPTPYDQEADAILKGMRALLWMPDEGAFGEYRDLLGEQRLHPSFGLWTYYHAIDSEVASPADAWRMSDALKRLPRIPIKGTGVPSDADYGLYATTDWLPYAWSINNVATQENLHTALALWRAGRADQAFVLAKSGLLASMFMGISPGNMGTLAWPDVYRRESQRDFADSAGVTARALVEGLFGLRPDALAGTMVIRPGFPANWDHASIAHPAFAYDFRRAGDEDRWSLKPGDRRFKTVVLRLPAPRDVVAGVEIDGVEAAWRSAPDAAGGPAIEIVAPGDRPSEVVVRWDGQPIAAPVTGSARTFQRVSRNGMTWLAPVGGVAAQPATATATATTAHPAVAGRMDPVNLVFNDRVTAIFAKGKYRSPRPAGASLGLPAQGIGGWAGHLNQMAKIDDTGLRRLAAGQGGQIATPEGVIFRTPGEPEVPNIAFTSLWDNYPKAVVAPLTGRARRLHLLMAGSTNPMQSRFDNGEVVVTYQDGTTTRLPLRNPDTWWPIEQDYFLDDYQFRVDTPPPTRVDLATGQIRVLDPATFKGQGREIPGGAATVLSLPLDPHKTLRALTVRTTANEVVIGLMAATLERQP